MDLSDLKKDISTLPDEQLFDILGKIRNSRAASHEKKQVKALDGRVKSAKKVEVDISAVFSGMTDEQKQTLLNKLRGGKS